MSLWNTDLILPRKPPNRRVCIQAHAGQHLSACVLKIRNCIFFTSIQLKPDKPFLSLWCVQVDKASAGLLALGLTKGDRLGMWGPNTYEWIVFQFATAKAGIILVSMFLILSHFIDWMSNYYVFVLMIFSWFSPLYRCLWIQRTNCRRLSMHCERWVTFTYLYLLLWPHRRLHDIKVNPLLLFPQVGCKAIVCHSQFKTQKYCDMLRQICPEIESSSPGGIKSARYCCVTCSVMVLTLHHYVIEHCKTHGNVTNVLFVNSL